MRRITRVAGLGILVLAVVAAPAAANVITVSWSGSGDYTDIWSAVLVADDGDTIRIGSGTYTGAMNTDVSLGILNLVIEPESGPNTVTIDGENTHGAFNITGGQDSTTVIRSLTMTNCHRESNGGAVHIYQSAPIIEGCVFEECSTGSNAGALNCNAASPIVRDCVFRGCSGTFRAGAVFSAGSHATYSRCLFDENEASPSWEGGGIFLNYTSDVVVNCTFTENVSDAIYVESSANAEIRNCVVAATVSGVGIYDGWDDGTEITHCIVFGNAEGDSLADHHHDNLFVDPLFCDAPNDDYTVCQDSQCLPGVNGWSELVGAYDQGCPPCGDPVESGSWGIIKALFR